MYKSKRTQELERQLNESQNRDARRERLAWLLNEHVIGDCGENHSDWELVLEIAHERLHGDD